MKFYKYHALGNDYIVLSPSEFGTDLSEEKIRRICHRNYGIGSDGILFGPTDTEEADFALRIFNPDGSEAEKSGNGLRIFSRFLWDMDKIGTDEFTILTAGGKVKAQVAIHGIVPLQAELGDDAAALLTTYAKLKEAIEAAKEITVKICQRKTGDRRPETVGKEETNVFLQPAVSSL